MFPRLLLRKCSITTMRIGRSILTSANNNMTNLPYKTPEIKKLLSTRTEHPIITSSNYMSSMSFRLPETRKTTPNSMQLKNLVRYG